MLIMGLYCVLAGLIVSIVATKSDTIHYTNSPTYLEPGANFTAYKLNVPGSNGITIIETIDDDSDSDDPDPIANYYPATNTKKMVYAPDLLQKFMKEYSQKQKTAYNNYYPQEEVYDEVLEMDPLPNRRVTRLKVHHKKKHQLYGNQYNDDKQGWVTLQAVPWSKGKPSKWKPNRVGPSATMSTATVNLYNVRPIGSLDNTQVYYGASNDDMQYNKQPTKRPSVFSDPYKNDGIYDRNDMYTTKRPERLRPKPLKKKDPSYYNTPEPQLEVDSTFDRWVDYGFRPNTDDKKITSNVYHTSETPKPPRKAFLSGNKHYAHRNELNNQGTIYAANSFDHQNDPHQDHSNMYQDRPDSLQSANYPTKGNDEWVLISSTKGYQYPSRRQRGIKRNNSTNASHYPVRPHKSIQLKVLPAKVTLSNVAPLMTTPPDDDFEMDEPHITVDENDESYKDENVPSSNDESVPSVNDESDQDSKDENVESLIDENVQIYSDEIIPSHTDEPVLNHREKKRKRKNKIKTTNAFHSIAFGNDGKADSTAVLAAVGAGMLPATVAMLMPMLGRKKREAKEELLPVQTFNMEKLAIRRL